MRLCFIQGKVYAKPTKTKSKNGKPMMFLSVGVSNNYSKDGEVVKMPLTFIEFTIFNEKLFPFIESIELKKDVVNIIGKFDIIENVKDNKRNLKPVFVLLKITKNNEDFYKDTIAVLQKEYFNIEEKEDYYDPNQVFKEKEKDDLPF